MKGNIGAFFRGLFLFSALIIVNLFQMASLVILPFSRRTFRAFNRGCALTWWGMCVIGSEKCLGVELHLTGDDVPMREKTILIANHQEMPDIVALMMFAWRKKRLGDLKWFVKNVIKYVPGIGWGMWFLDCVFLKRNWDADQGRIRATFSKFVDNGIPLWLISFVEGTRLKPHKLEKSREYAAKQGLPLPRYTLVPRTKGFIATVEGLRTHIDAIYDVTIGYPGGVPTLWEYLKGNATSLHLHVRRFAVSDLPADRGALSQWLMTRFQEKDRLLAHFHERGHFPAMA